jgi:ferrous iron transport protein B
VPAPLLRYDPVLERDIARVEQLILAQCPHPRLAARGLAILAIGRDPEVEAWLAAQANSETVRAALAELTAPIGRDSLPARLARERGGAAEALARTVTQQAAGKDRTLSMLLGRIAVHRLWGWPMLLGVLYLVYLFVGDFGASTLVGLLEEDFFGEVLNPAVTEFVTSHISTPWLADLIVGEYGLWTMGMTYALALILPIVTTFFLAFGVLEDSGYFSRLSVIANRMFAAIGLNGRAVLPMVLGLGCVTMATLTTRILHTPRERLITIYLMALAIPCSAQLGVVLGLLGGISFGATLIWVLAIVGVLLFTGWLASKVVPGRRVPLVTELPPMRMPVLGNVLKKTGGRLKWYLIEVIPLFLIGTLIMFGLDRSGALPWIIEAGEPLVVGWLGLPPEASAAFVMGFLRRDFGASGLFALQSELSMIQAVVGMVTITLFVPCIASLMMIIKEQGMKVALLMLAMIIPTAFLIGGLLNHGLRLIF